MYYRYVYDLILGQKLFSQKQTILPDAEKILLHVKFHGNVTYTKISLLQITTLSRYHQLKMKSSSSNDAAENKN